MENQHDGAGQLQQNPDIRELMKLLKQYNPARHKEYAELLWQVENMSRQLDRAMRELQEVRAQLDRQKSSPVRQTVRKAVKAVEDKIIEMRNAVSDMKEQLIKGAREAVEGFKYGGTKALDMTVSILGIKKGLEAMRDSLKSSLRDMGKTIKTVEDFGREMRGVGSHIRNAAYVVVGKDPLAVADRGEGRFQAAILTPLRRERDIQGRLLSLVNSAIRRLEKLEKAADRTPEDKRREAGEPEKKPEPQPERQPENRGGKRRTEAAKENSRQKEQEGQTPPADWYIPNDWYNSQPSDSRREAGRQERAEGQTSQRNNRNDREQGSRKAVERHEKRQGEKTVEKPSVLKELRENQAKAAAHTAPAPVRGNPAKGVAL